MSRIDYMREWRRENRSRIRAYRAQWANENPSKIRDYRAAARVLHNNVVNVFKSNPCTDCSNSFSVFCMEFDHRPGTDKVCDVCDMIGYHSLDTILEEIQKCDLVCRNCHRVRTANRAGPLDRSAYSFAVQRILDEVDRLRSRPCMDCQISYPFPAMDFDHVLGKKVSSISRMKRSAGMGRVLDEIKKCELVCANCHAIRTCTRDIDKLHASARNRRVA